MSTLVRVNLLRASLAEPPSNNKGERECEVLPVLYSMGISEVDAASVLTNAAKPLSWEVDPDNESQNSHVAPDFSGKREESLASYSASKQKEEQAVAVAEQIWDADVTKWKANVTEVYEYLLSFDINSGGITKMLRRCPQLLRMSVEDVKAAVEFIRDLGIADKSLGRVLVSEPTLLCFKVEEHLKPGVEYILQTGVPRGSIGVLTTLNANLLSSAVEEKRRLDRTSSLFAEANKADRKLAYLWAAGKAKEARDYESRVKQGLPVDPRPLESTSFYDGEGDGDSAESQDAVASVISGAKTDQQKEKYLFAAQLAAQARKGASMKKGADRR
eukprot:CAMPEP_0198198630 /NCGR_PEP_ID=MMETSP1445-20131203/2089_1 /TAXON_ID=36898 /ORGANISM="Pyramimonas sp., Strain CCMP2087" /LENGTH=329 /DNA_ID=CAMNT_0043868253 /DNA_START=349 /DNA_END=1337 /DNA_ORIENTATION=+